MNPNDYLYEVAEAYWPGLPRDEFEEYIALGVDAAVLLELEWQDMVLQDGPELDWQDMSAADILDQERIRQFYDHGFGLVFELMRGIGPPDEMSAADHRGNIVHNGMVARAGHGPILDYGGGIGQQSLFLARKGWKVGYTDLGETAAFARWRFEREGLLAGPNRRMWTAVSVHVLRSPDFALRPLHEKGSIPWGALIALDVVEHIPDPVDLLRRFDAALAPDGLLFLTRHSFRPYPTHLPETGFLMEKLDDVLAGMGYRPVIPPDGHFGIGAWQKTGPAVDASLP
ncbi:MAG: class I SAM-dependent methyltransferase [Methyloceanibacter sp.]|nr:class I SAM-dependent methyltransferase [Methyloceanibacter sp.]